MATILMNVGIYDILNFKLAKKGAEAMRVFLVLFVMLIGAVGLTGCATAPTAEMLNAADYGIMPTTTFAKDSASTWIKMRLKDPDSAQITYGDIDRGWFREGFGGKTRYAWRLPTSVNAKNSFGGYTGAKPWMFYFHGEKMVGFGEHYRGGMIYVEMDGVDWGESNANLK